MSTKKYIFWAVLNKEQTALAETSLPFTDIKNVCMVFSTKKMAQLAIKQRIDKEVKLKVQKVKIVQV